MKTLNLDHPIVRQAYIKHQDNKVALIVIETDALWPELVATGAGAHPCIVFGDQECIFADFDSAWDVFGCESQKHGFTVTLFKQEASED